MLRWLARLSLPKALALALAWPLALLLMGAAVIAWLLFGEIQGDNGYMVSFSADPLMSVVLWGPPLVVLVTWVIVRPCSPSFSSRGVEAGGVPKQFGCVH